MINKLLAKVIGTQNERELKRLHPLVGRVGELDAGLRNRSDAEIRSRTTDFRERHAKGEALDAPAVGFTFTTDPVPTPLGGEIADGTYFITEFLAHTSVLLPTHPFIRAKIVISGTTWQEVEGSPDFDELDPPSHYTSTATTNGTQISVTRSCPSVGQPESAGYTATPESLTLHVVDAGIAVSTVLTKQ